MISINDCHDKDLYEHKKANGVQMIVKNVQITSMDLSS